MKKSTYWRYTLGLIAVIAWVNGESWADDKILSMKAPALVHAGQVATVDISYETTTNRDIWVSFHLNRPPWTTYGDQRLTVTERKGDIVFEIPIHKDAPSSKNKYRIRSCLLPVGADFYSTIHSVDQEPIGCKGRENQILAVAGPESITPQMDAIVIPVTYTTIRKRVIQVDLLDQKSRKNYGQSKMEVPSGSNTVEVVVAIDGNIPPQKDAYMYAVNLLPPGFNKDHRLAFMAQKDVDCIVAEACCEKCQAPKEKKKQTE